MIKIKSVKVFGFYPELTWKDHLNNYPICQLFYKRGNNFFSEKRIEKRPEILSVLMGLKWGPYDQLDAHYKNGQDLFNKGGL